MDEYANRIKAVSNALKNLFAEGGTLKGISDWDVLIQCVLELDSISEQMEGEKNG